MRSAFLSLTAFMLVLFFTTPSFALDCSSETYNASISDIYSDLETCDITLHSSEQVSGLKLEISIEHEGSILDRKTFAIDNITPEKDIVKSFKWNTSDNGDGKYTVKSVISRNECTIYENAYSFVSGRQTIPRIKVDDLVSNSQGFSVMITPQEAALVDVEYMLIDGSDVIYSGTEKKIAVYTLPTEVRKNWNVLLENNKKYSGRVKVKLYSPSVSYIALTNDFTAHDDVYISDTYDDDIGASATIYGMSQVPFTGSVRFTVSKQNESGGTIVESVTKKSPVILNGKDETVETIWKERLTTGIYALVIEVIGNDGNILDVEESIIESNYVPPINQTNTTNAQATKKSSGFMFPGTLAIIVIAALIVFRQRKH